MEDRFETYFVKEVMVKEQLIANVLGYENQRQRKHVMTLASSITGMQENMVHVQNHVEEERKTEQLFVKVLQDK